MVACHVGRRLCLHGEEGAVLSVGIGGAVYDHMRSHPPFVRPHMQRLSLHAEPLPKRPYPSALRATGAGSVAAGKLGQKSDGG